eukprot:scaffold75273_cov31-Tisochrysis_lutea.AAC.2
MSRFCNIWIFCTSSKLAGSEPSNLRQRCTFMGFSNSSERARTWRKQATLGSGSATVLGGLQRALERA